ncbi:MAG: Trk system potassium transporter TrkA [Thermodesulfobacteriota bacterium]
MRIMIVGAGQVGHYLCEKLSVEGQEVVLVDSDENKLRKLERDLNILPMRGSGASARVLEEAGIKQTDLFIAVTDSDEVNLIACILSKQYNVKRRIARVRNEDFYTSGEALNEKALGIDLLISPDIAMADEIMTLSQLSNAFAVAEFAGGQVELLGYEVYKGNPMIGVTLHQMQAAKKRHTFIIVAIIRDGETIIPRGDDRLASGDRIFLVARKKDIHEVEALFHFTSRAPKRVFIIGGGTIGFQVAKRMERKKVRVSVVDRDPKRCEFLTEQLAHSVVLNFDGLDSHELLQEGIDQADLVIAATHSDTTNILSSLLAKHHGVRKCITKITRPDFLPLLGKLGIDAPLSPRLVAANMILRFVRGSGNIVAVATLLGSDAEVMELHVGPEAKFIGQALKEMKFPQNAVLGAVVRKGRVIIPSGETTLEEGDNLVVFFTREALARVEEFFR